MQLAPMPRSVTLLGATGSIGSSTIDLLRREPEHYRVEAVTANRSAAALAKLARELGARFAAVGDPEHVADRLAQYVRAGVRGVLAWPIRSTARPSGLRLLAEQVWPHVGVPTLTSA